MECHASKQVSSQAATTENGVRTKSIGKGKLSKQAAKGKKFLTNTGESVVVREEKSAVCVERNSKLNVRKDETVFLFPLLRLEYKDLVFSVADIMYNLPL